MRPRTRHARAPEPTSPRLASTPIAALLVLALGASSGFGSTARTAEAISFEAEDYVASTNVGGSAIWPVGCSAARGGMAVDGMDAAGDFIEWDLTLPGEFVFRDSLRSAGAIGLVRRFAILFLPAGGGPPVATDTLTTPSGLGIG